MTRRIALLFLLASLCSAVLPGCQTPLAFPEPAPDWQTHTGQLHYRSATGRSVVGDVVVRRSPRGDFQLAFSSGPGFPLLRLWQLGDNARAEGAVARGSWQGRREKAPGALRGWLQLREVFARSGAPAKGQTLTLGGDQFAFHFSR
jgi:hypothetical protein